MQQKHLHLIEDLDSEREPTAISQEIRRVLVEDDKSLAAAEIKLAFAEIQMRDFAQRLEKIEKHYAEVT